MRKSHLQLYAPFIALAIVQALFVIAAPSTGGPTGTALGGVSDEFRTGPGFEDDDFSDDEFTDDGFAFGDDADPGATPGTPGATQRRGAGPGSPGTPGSPGSPGGAGVAGDGRPAGDTSHCTRDGRQHGVTYHAPPCQPKWPEGADNGGSTYRGVTDDEVLIISFASQPNEQVDAILAAEGLAATPEEERQFREAAVEFINKHYEFYGRTVKVERVVGDCPTTPPDFARCRTAANEVVRMNPFAVVWGTPLYAEVFDIWARNGILSVGGWHFDGRFFNDRRPFRWDVQLDGDSTADALAEYYCKKLAGNNASHSGQIIHRNIGVRGQVPRKLGIVTPEIEANVLSARRVMAQVKQCSGVEPVLFTYESDINRAEEQTRTTVAGLIEANVTTVACMCDPIAPVFLTEGMTRNEYFPENLVAGTSFIDFDKLGRLYSPPQWRHAFGISVIGQPIPHGETDASVVWRDVGRSGEPCQSCNLPWAYYSLLGAMVQNSGPNLNPLNVERGMFQAGPRGGWERTGGRADIVLVQFGPNDYTAISDFREVYWSASARSPIDGRPGAYVSPQNGRRFENGQLDGEMRVPVP